MNWITKILRTHANRAAQLLVVLSGAFALKQYYSTASVNQLRWMLAPTTFIVEIITGLKFDFESHAGYMSSDRTFVIAASCAGVNFFITAFLMLALRKFWSERAAAKSASGLSMLTSWRFIPVAALVAYVATIVANTVRIATALHLKQSAFEIGGLSGNQLHRLEGIFIYFGFLFLLFVLVEKTSRRSATVARVSGESARRFQLLRASCFPLLIYYATALGIPFANAIYRKGTMPADFWEHSAFVLLAPLVIILPIAIWQFVSNKTLSTMGLTGRPHSAFALRPLRKSKRPLRLRKGRPQKIAKPDAKFRREKNWISTPSV